jgi:hypothetical protein
MGLPLPKPVFLVLTRKCQQNLKLAVILNFISVIIYKSISYDKYANLRNF